MFRVIWPLRDSGQQAFNRWGGGGNFSILFAAESCTKYIESVDQILFHLHVMLQISNYNMLLYYEQDNVYFTKLMLQEETFATTMRTGEKQTTK